MAFAEMAGSSKVGPGAQFMEFRISPEDRVGGQPANKRGQKAAPKRTGWGAKKVEPSMGAVAVGNFVDDERSGSGTPPPPRKPQRGKAKPVKAKKSRKRSGGGFLMRLF